MLRNKKPGALTAYGRVINVGDLKIPLISYGVHLYGVLSDMQYLKKYLLIHRTEILVPLTILNIVLSLTKRPRFLLQD